MHDIGGPSSSGFVKGAIGIWTEDFPSPFSKMTGSGKSYVIRELPYFHGSLSSPAWESGKDGSRRWL